MAGWSQLRFTSLETDPAALYGSTAAAVIPYGLSWKAGWPCLPLPRTQTLTCCLWKWHSNSHTMPLSLALSWGVSSPHNEYISAGLETTAPNTVCTAFLFIHLFIFCMFTKGTDPEKDRSFSFQRWNSLPDFHIGTRWDYFSKASRVMSTVQKTLCSFYLRGHRHQQSLFKVTKSLHRALRMLFRSGDWCSRGSKSQSFAFCVFKWSTARRWDSSSLCASAASHSSLPVDRAEWERNPDCLSTGTREPVQKEPECWDCGYPSVIENLLTDKLIWVPRPSCQST